MTSDSLVLLQTWLTDIGALLDQEENPESKDFLDFLQDEQWPVILVDLMEQIEESAAEENTGYYSACILAFDICVAQLQAAHENGNKRANKLLSQLMTALAKSILKSEHSLSFWLPVLNGFYEANIELSDDLKDAYLELASEEEDFSSTEDISHLDAIRNLIIELSDLSVFDIAEHFFAQSYAMPPDFFADLLVDLYNIEEGEEIAILTLLHPKHEVREMVMGVYDYLMPQITLSSISLTRLQTIKYWYHDSYHPQFDHWIKLQRKKGVVFSPEHSSNDKALIVKASEIDGSGAQGIFIQMQTQRKYRLGGLLFKHGVGIKDAWITTAIPKKEVAHYYKEAFGEGIILRVVDWSYLMMMTNHFLAITLEQGSVPDLHLLQIQETLGQHWRPKRLDVASLIEHLAIEISPFTPDTMQASLKRSKSWSKNKQFTESWFLESARVDKLVNRYCNFVDGVKLCDFEEAKRAVFTEELEKQRHQWLFHFLWVALWMKAGARKSEKMWQDSFFIAYLIHQGEPLKNIPLMQEICRQSVVNSVETMQERRTHLN